MRIFLKDNNVLQYEQKLNVSDIEIEYAGDADIAKKHVYLGENGVGKTFDFRMFVNTAYLYSVANPSPYHDIDAQRVMQNMIDVGIGTLENVPLDDEKYFLIERSASFYTEDEDEKPQNSDNLTERFLMDTARLLKKLDTKFRLKLGKSARRFFEKYNIIYYSNSQFPSNDTFFSSRASSFRAEDVDPIFWMIYRNLDVSSSYEMKIWKNNSMHSLKKENKIEIYEEVKRKISSDDFARDLKYKYRSLFNYLHIDLINAIEKSNIIELIEKFYLGDETHPGVVLPLRILSIYDYIVLLLFREADKSVNFELYYKDGEKSYPWSKLNSGNKYLLILKCLKSVYKNDRVHKTVIIVDEPENSLHLKTLKEIVQADDENCIIWVATHSPAYAKSLISINGNVNVDDENNIVLHVASIEKKEQDDRDTIENINIQCEEIYNEDILPDLSLDTIAAEFFSYSPFVEEFERVNRHIDERNMISIDDFYEQVNGLGDE